MPIPVSAHVYPSMSLFIPFHVPASAPRGEATEAAPTKVPERRTAGNRANAGENTGIGEKKMDHVDPLHDPGTCITSPRTLLITRQMMHVSNRLTGVSREIQGRQQVQPKRQVDCPRTPRGAAVRSYE
jgi:hypothetical protein